jgi:hypothetical protein
LKRSKRCKSIALSLYSRIGRANGKSSRGTAASARPVETPQESRPRHGKRRRATSRRRLCQRNHTAAPRRHVADPTASVHDNRNDCQLQITGRCPISKACPEPSRRPQIRTEEPGLVFAASPSVCQVPLNNRNGLRCLTGSIRPPHWQPNTAGPAVRIACLITSMRRYTALRPAATEREIVFAVPGKPPNTTRFAIRAPPALYSP